MTLEVVGRPRQAAEARLRAAAEMLQAEEATRRVAAAPQKAAEMLQSAEATHPAVETLQAAVAMHRAAVAP